MRSYRFFFPHVSPSSRDEQHDELSSLRHSPQKQSFRHCPTLVRPNPCPRLQSSPNSPEAGRHSPFPVLPACPSLPIKPRLSHRAQKMQALVWNLSQNSASFGSACLGYWAEMSRLVMCLGEIIRDASYERPTCDAACDSHTKPVLHTVLPPYL